MCVAIQTDEKIGQVQFRTPRPKYVKALFQSLNIRALLDREVTQDPLQKGNCGHFFEGAFCMQNMPIVGLVLFASCVLDIRGSLWHIW